MKADLALWAPRFVATGNDLAEVQRKIAKDDALVRAFLLASGFAAAEAQSQGLARPGDPARLQG